MITLRGGYVILAVQCLVHSVLSQGTFVPLMSMERSGILSLPLVAALQISLGNVSVISNRRQNESSSNGGTTIRNVPIESNHFRPREERPTISEEEIRRSLGGRRLTPRQHRPSSSELFP